MTKFRIDNKEYDSETLSDEAKKHVEALMFVRGEIIRCQRQLAALQTAQNSYAKVLQGMIEGEGAEGEAANEVLPDSISFD